MLLGTASVDAIRGLGGDDEVTGGAGPDDVSGGPGHDVLKGGKGKDILWAEYSGDEVEDGSVNDGDFDDLLFGGGGRDTLYDALGDSVLNGQAANDRIWMSSGEGTTDAGPGDDVIRVYPDKFRDTIRCGDGNDTVRMLATYDGQYKENLDKLFNCEALVKGWS